MSKGLLAKTAAVIVTTGGLVAISATDAPDAKAYACGHFTEWEDHESWAHIDLPIVGSVDLFGGKREVAHYGHCGDGNVRITVNTADGDQSLCVQPGDTRLGFATMDRKISYSYYTGGC